MIYGHYEESLTISEVLWGKPTRAPPRVGLRRSLAPESGPSVDDLDFSLISFDPADDGIDMALWDRSERQETQLGSLCFAK